MSLTRVYATRFALTCSQLSTDMSNDEQSMLRHLFFLNFFSFPRTSQEFISGVSKFVEHHFSVGSSSQSVQSFKAVMITPANTSSTV